MKKIISLLLVCLMVIPTGIFASVGVSADTTQQTVYLSDSGADTNDGLSADTPVKNITKAYQLLGEAGGTITIVGTFTQTANYSAPAHTGTVTITGNTADAVYDMGTAGRRFFLGGPTVFDDITLGVTTGSFLVVCLYNNFTATENLSMDGTKDVILVAGTQDKANDFGSARDVTITINGGRWTEIIGGMRQSVTVAGSVTKTPEDFKDHNVTFNIGGNTEITKFFSFFRTVSTVDFIAPNSSCTVNLNGGTIKNFLCHNDQKSHVQGYENGLTVKIGKGFNLAGSFDAVTTIDPDTRLGSNSLFYGISAFSAYDASVTSGTMISCNTLVVDDDIYDSVIADNKIRIGDFDTVMMTSECIDTVYLSDSGADTNDGLSQNAPVKTLGRAYEILGTSGGSIIIVDTYTQSSHFFAPEHTGTVTVKGADASSKYVLGAGCRYFLGGSTVFDGFKLDATNYTFLVVCLYNDFAATDTFSVEGTKDVILVAGGQSDKVYSNARGFDTANDVSLTINGGRWSEVVGGMRQGWNSPTADGYVVKTADDFKDYDVTISIGGVATIGKLFAFNRGASGNMIAAGSSCTINLDGGVITHFICQNDQKAYVQGYENGLTINVSKNFDITKSFDAIADVDPDTRLSASDTSNKVYYGISPLYAYDDSKITATGTMPENATLVVDDEIYNSFIADTKVRKDDFSSIKMAGEIPTSDKVVYLSSSGDNANDGLSADTPVKTITTAYHLLGAEGGTIVIVGTFNHSAHYSAPAHTGKVVIKGADSTAKYVMAGDYRYFLGGPTVFTDITLDVTNKTMYFICLYNDFMATDTFVVEGTKNVLLGAGAQNAANDFGSAKDVSITLNGGRWTEVFGGIRGGLTVSGGVTKTADNFKDHDVTFNIGGEATIGKLFAFNRSAAGNIIAPGSSCTINLDGGVITHFICQNDQKAYVQGYENGITINVSKNFDITKSFDAIADVDPDTRLSASDTTNKVYYGISPLYAYDDSMITATGTMPSNAVLVVDDEIYDSFIADTKVRIDDFSKLMKKSGEIDYTTVYVSDDGDDANDAITPDTPVKTLDAAYGLLGDNGGTIIIVGTYTQSANFFEPEHSGKIVIKGADENAVYNVAKNTRFTLDGETEFENIHIRATGSATWYVICNFNSFKVADTVTVTRTGVFIITLGAQSGATANDRDCTPKDATLTLEGGDWGEIIGFARNGFTAPSTIRTEADYAGVDLVITIDKNASVDKIFGFGRTVSNGSSFAPDANLRINLLGGQVNNFLGQTDNRTYAHGVINGMVVYIGRDFDISKSFLDGNQTEDHLVNDGGGRYIFYGLSGESSYSPKYVVSTQIKRSGLVIAAELYDSIKDHSRILASTFGYIIKEGDTVPAYGPFVRPETSIVYVSSKGHDLNNGKATNNAVKSLSVALEILGENSGTIYIKDSATLSADITGTKHNVVVMEGATLNLNAAVSGFAGYSGKGTIVVSDENKALVTVTDFEGFDGKIVDSEGNDIFTEDQVILTGTTGDCEFTYNWLTQTLTVTGNGVPGALVRARFARDIIFGEGVSAIPDNFCFNNTNLKSVTLSSTITSIGRYAFGNTSGMTTLNVPEDSRLSYIGFKAFLFSGITSVDFNDNLKTIDGYAFRDCHDLVSADLGNSLESLGEYAFARTFALQTVTFDGTFTTLSDNVFLQASALSSITIPDSVTVIGSKAFMNAGALTAVVFPENLTAINTDAFKESGLTGSITLPATVTVIGDRVFYKCTNLTGIVLPNGLESFGTYSFALSGITAIEIPESVAQIPAKAFYGCSDLGAVSMNGVSTIGGYAFSASGITSIVIPEGCTTLDSGIFWGCESLATVTINASIETIPAKTFYNCKALSSIELPETVSAISSHAFFNCASLSSIALPDALTSIGGYAFSYSNLTSIELPAGVTQIPDKAFDHCAALSTVTVKGDLSSIGNYAFAESGLVSFVIPETCTTVGNGVFYKCSELETVTINAQLKGITTKMFYNCTSLTSVNIPETVVNIHPYAFYNCTSLASIELPSGLKLLYNYAFANTTALAVDITIPGTVNEIGEKCFAGSGITTVTFGDGIVTVYDGAFENTALTDAYLTKSVSVIGENAFSSAVEGALIALHTEADAEAVIAWANANTDKVTLDTTYVAQ